MDRVEVENYIGRYECACGNCLSHKIIQGEERHAEADLIRVLFLALANGWRNGQTALHVHVRVRLVGESVSDNLCFLFQRKFCRNDSLFKQNSFRVPTNNSANIFANEWQLSQQGIVLIHIGESFDNTDTTRIKRAAFVRLRLLDDCPRVPINRYPIQNAKLWLSLSELDFIEEAFLTIIDRKLTPPTWFMTISKDKLAHEVVQGTTEIVDNISNNNRKANVRLRERFSHYNIPGAITPYIEPHNIGVLFDPSVNLRFEAPIVLFGPPELGSDPRKRYCRICGRPLTKAQTEKGQTTCEICKTILKEK